MSTVEWDVPTIVSFSIICVAFVLSEILGELPAKYVEAGSVIGFIIRALLKVRDLIPSLLGSGGAISAAGAQALEQGMVAAIPAAQPQPAPPAPAIPITNAAVGLPK